MKQKPKLHLLGLFVLLLLAWATPAAASAATLVVDGGGGALLSFTSLPGLETGRQASWNAFFGMEGSSGPEFGFIGRLQFEIFGLKASAPQSDGNLYRAWNGTGLGLLAGLRFSDFPLPLLSLPAHVQLGMGGGLRITKYSGTGLVSAHPSMLGRLSLGVDIFGPVTFSLALPFELAWKSGSTAVIIGIAASVGYR